MIRKPASASHGSRNQGSVANEAAAFALFQKRMDITHGLFWEDPFRGVTTDAVSTELSIERYKRLRDVAVPKGRYVVHTVNTREGNQSTFPTTDAAQQKALARYYLAQFLGNNILQSIRFNAVDNGVLDVGTQTGSPGNFTLTLPFEAVQASFVLRRSASGRATTVRFVVTDGCGDWQSFAGLGSGVP